jgi:hypothetical protein
MCTWIFGAPLIILFVLYKKRKNLDDPDTLRTFGFWYLGIKRECFYWELVMELKKLLMIMISVNIFQMDTTYQVFLILLILFITFTFESNLKPYKYDNCNTVCYVAEFAQFSTFAFAMVFL